MRQPVRQLLARGFREQAEVAADRKVRPVAGDQHGADIRPLGNLGCGFGKIGRHVGIDRIAVVIAIQTH